MKYGLIIFENTENLGDDIQSYAAMQFLPRVDYIIEREHIDDFYPKTGEKVATILSGWYLYSHLNWPPSPYLYALPISIHFDTEKYTVLGKKLTENNVINGLGKEWLLHNEPIGARDLDTQELIINNGIKSYFSGCLTLTLQPYNNIEKHNSVVVIDVGKQIEKYLSEKARIPFVNKTHKMPMHNYTFKERMTLVEERLKFYQGASLVITKRLHAALPCLALGTPVLLIVEEYISNRIKTYCNYLNFISEKELLEGKCKYSFTNPPDNPNLYRECAEILKQICNDYISECQGITDIELSSIEVFKDGVSRTKQLKKILTERLNIENEKEKYKIFL